MLRVISVLKLSFLLSGEGDNRSIFPCFISIRDIVVGLI